jgi:hypothetical protein
MFRCRDGIIGLAALRVPYGYTVHDLNFVPDDPVLGRRRRLLRPSHRSAAARRAACAAALRKSTSSTGDCGTALSSPTGVPHRAVALCRVGARYYFEHRVGDPARDAGQWALQTDDAAGALPPMAPKRGVALPDDGVTTIAVLGAVGRTRRAPLERLPRSFVPRPARAVLIGYMDVEKGPWQSDDAVLTVHGRYEPRDLPDLLAQYRVQLVAFPSAGPETFSFTLSEAWAAGLPVIVPPFGALAERVADTNAGWLWTDAEWRDETRMLARMLELVARQARPALAAAARGHGWSSRRLRDGGRTLRIYSEVKAPCTTRRRRRHRGGCRWTRIDDAPAAACRRFAMSRLRPARRGSLRRGSGNGRPPAEHEALLHAARRGARKTIPWRSRGAMPNSARGSCASGAALRGAREDGHCASSCWRVPPPRGTMRRWR